MFQNRGAIEQAGQRVVGGLDVQLASRGFQRGLLVFKLAGALGDHARELALAPQQAPSAQREYALGDQQPHNQIQRVQERRLRGARAQRESEPGSRVVPQALGVLGTRGQTERSPKMRRPRPNFGRRACPASL
jgi:hypothetical protein